MTQHTSLARNDSHSQTITHLSVCSGYDGLGLGLARVFGAISPVAYVEIEAFAIANLVAKMETNQMAPAPIWTDVAEFPFQEFRGKVDILHCGYPCQPFSTNGKRKGQKDGRALWWHVANGIWVCRPSVVFLENVEGHITLGLREVLEDLAGLGYKTAWGIFSAAEVGAPHRRKRVFILAYTNNSRGNEDFKQPKFWAARTEQSSQDSRVWGEQGEASQGQKGRGESGMFPAAPEGEPKDWEVPRTVERRVRGAAHGGDCRVDRLLLLGNGVVPAQAEHAFRTLAGELWGQ
jgi:DNA (cytosine-5)-methyltransferase 1